VPAGVPALPEFLLTTPAHPLPNPAINSKLQNPSAKRLVRWLLAFRSRPTNTTKTNSRRNAVGGIHRTVGICQERAVVAMEIETEETLEPLGVTEGGLTVQTELAGDPVHERETV